MSRWLLMINMIGYKIINGHLICSVSKMYCLAEADPIAHILLLALQQASKMKLKYDSLTTLLAN